MQWNSLLAHVHKYHIKMSLNFHNTTILRIAIIFMRAKQISFRFLLYKQLIKIHSEIIILWGLSLL